MHRTMFNTPVVNTLLRWISILVLKLCGWKTEGTMPENSDRCVMIAAPHTSNWDLPFTLMTAFALKAQVYWMGKEQIFKPPFKGIMMWMGGIPVVRERSTNMVAASVDALKNNKKLILIVPPEGTRSKTVYWKTGFYHIAHGASVPIILGFLDFKRKAGGVGPLLHTTGNIEADMVKIKEFYAPIQGKRADLYHQD